MASFYPPLAADVRAGIYTSLRSILEKRVLPYVGSLSRALSVQ